MLAEESAAEVPDQQRFGIEDLGRRRGSRVDEDVADIRRRMRRMSRLESRLRPPRPGRVIPPPRRARAHRWRPVRMPKSRTRGTVILCQVGRVFRPAGSWRSQGHHDRPGRAEPDDQRGDRAAVEGAHLLLVVRPGRRRSHRDRSCRGRVAVHAGRQAHPRLQQPADVGEHRARRPAGRRRDRRAGDTGCSSSSPRSSPRFARVSARSSPGCSPATSTRSSSRSAAQRRSRTRSRSLASTPAATRSSPATGRITAPPWGP